MNIKFVRAIDTWQADVAMRGDSATLYERDDGGFLVVVERTNGSQRVMIWNSNDQGLPFGQWVKREFDCYDVAGLLKKAGYTLTADDGVRRPVPLF